MTKIGNSHIVPKKLPQNLFPIVFHHPDGYNIPFFGQGKKEEKVTKNIVKSVPSSTVPRNNDTLIANKITDTNIQKSREMAEREFQDMFDLIEKNCVERENEKILHTVSIS